MPQPVPVRSQQFGQHMTTERAPERMPPHARLRRAPARRLRAQRGAALLAAMLTVTLVATFAAAAMWQQWRALEIETAERARQQSAWILAGALDWSRLILREDARAGGADHLAEPWAVALQEARLSTFLAAERNVTQVEDASTDTADAFLSGQISDLQARLNLTNLFQGTQDEKARALQQFGRLFAQLGLPAQQLALLVSALRSTQSGSTQTGSAQTGGTANSANSNSTANTASESGQAPLLPPTTSQLGWLGLPAQTVAALAPYVTLLPHRTQVNINTADQVVLLAAFDGMDIAGAQKLMQAREARHFRSVQQAGDLLGRGVDILRGSDVNSSYFEVWGRLRLGEAVVDERSLMYRDGQDVKTLWRERAAPAPNAIARDGAR